MTTQKDGFAGRVNYAAAFMLRPKDGRRRQTTRAFDSCFENGDGDAVLAALVRRAVRNERLRAALPLYLRPESIAKAAESMRIAARLESLRKEIRAERISQGEICELEDLADHIDPFDVELLQWANVPEEEAMRRQEAATAKK